MTEAGITKGQWKTAYREVNQASVSPDSDFVVKTHAIEITSGNKHVLTAFVVHAVPDAEALAEFNRNVDFICSAATVANETGKTPGELLAQRDAAILLLAEWCDAIDRNGTGWDDWDEHYKDAAYRPGPLRQLIDAELAKLKLARGEAE